MYELKAQIFGVVQGVFFRKTVQDHAIRMGLNGYAKNLDNGAVELLVQGNKEDLELFLKEVKKNPGRALIKTIDFSIEKADKPYKGFHIL